MSLQQQIALVIHVEPGGFHLTEEVVGRLRARKVAWIDKLGHAQQLDASGCLEHRWYLPHNGDNLRMDPDLVAVVREIEAEIQERYGLDPDWRHQVEAQHRELGGLKVALVTVVLEIEDHDGVEQVCAKGVSSSVAARRSGSRPSDQLPR
jgi:hypothetical protein